MSVVGIDLGTTNTVVASVRAGKVHVLADERGERLLPSVVSFHPNGELLVGSAARARRIIDPKNTVYSHKRLIGRAWGSPELVEAKQRLTFELREGPGQAAVVHARSKTLTLPEISAFVLKRARQIAETALGDSVTHAVITVPAHFNELQRASTKAAGRISGLEVLRILNEPTAAALAYGLGRTGTERVAVYDFGGGTFDCTLLNLNGNVFEVLATSGDTFLGGDDVDALIADRMAEILLRTHRVDLRTDASLFARLRTAAEEIKIALSTADTHTVLVSDVAHGMGGSAISFSYTLTRAELDELMRPLIARTLKVTEDALALARLTPTAFDKVLLVGGSTRIPAVRARVEAFFGRKPLDRVNPDEVVAIGAAIQAAALSDAHKRRSIPPPPGILTAKPRTAPGAPAPAPAPPPQSSSGLAPSATEAGRRALIDDVARRPAANKVTNPGLGRSQTTPKAHENLPSLARTQTGPAAHDDLPTLAGARPRAKSVTNEVPGGVFGLVGDVPLAPSDDAKAKAPSPTVPSDPRFDLFADLPVVKAEDDVPPPRAKAKATPASSDDVTATFTLEDTREGPTLTLDTTAKAAQPPLDHTLRMRRGSSPSLADTATTPGARPLAPPQAPMTAPMSPMRARAPSVPPPVPTQTARGPGFAALSAPMTAPLPVPPVTAPLPATAPSARVPMSSSVPPLALPGFGQPASLPSGPRAPSEPPPPRMPSIGPLGSLLSLETMPQGAAPILIDVTPRALVVETAGGFTNTIISRNAKVPCDRTHKFATGSHMQTSVRIRVAQGEAPTFEHNTYLGEVELSGLRAAPRGEVVVAVTFEVDSDGTVKVRARDLQTGQEAQASLKLIGVADDADITAMMNRAGAQPIRAGEP